MSETHRLSETLEQVIDRRLAFLTEYQNAAYAAHYAYTSAMAVQLLQSLGPTLAPVLVHSGSEVVTEGRVQLSQGAGGTK